MKLVLLSGGSGKRLWPLSNDTRSKQFLKVLENPAGGKESMVQRVWRQLEAAGLKDDAVIATGKGQLDLIGSQLGSGVPVVVEPERRDTFPAVALAVSNLVSEHGLEPNEVVIVLPVDPYVDSGFFSALIDLENALKESGADLALMGVEPSEPSVKYGYIVPQAKEGQEDYFQVSHFREKPSAQEALELINQHAFWNCGVFAFKAKYILEIINELGMPIEHKALLSEYGQLPKISFDYQVVEKAESIIAIKYPGEWKDLGTWNTLTENLSAGVIGNGLVGEDCSNTHLINELDIPVVVLGVKDLIVAVSPDGILVSDKDVSHRVKDLAGDLAHRPMYEERRWGWYRVLDFTKTSDGEEVLVKRIGIHTGKSLSYQMHQKRSEVWTIIRGSGEFALNGKIRTVSKGDVLIIQIGDKHGIKANEELEIIETQAGSELIEEDIARLFMNWDEVREHCGL